MEKLWKPKATNKKDINIQDVVIIWSANAWIAVANQLETLSDKLNYRIIGKNLWNTAMSPWNIRMENPETLYNRLKGNIDENDHDKKKLLQYFVEHHQKSVSDLLSKLNIWFLNTNYWIRVDSDKPWKLVIDRWINQLWIRSKIINSSITKIVKVSSGFDILLSTKEWIKVMRSKKLIIASWWKWHTKELTTWNTSLFPNILDMMQENWIEVENLDEASIHPFLTIGKEIWKKLISWEYLTKSDFYKVDKEKNESPVLPIALTNAIKEYKYTHLFNEITKYFRKAIENGYKILMKTNMSKDEYEKFIITNEFWKYFKWRSLDKVKSLEIAPWYHYTLWWVKIDENLVSVSDSNIMALWEAASIFWRWRVWGIGHSDSITLAKKIALVI